jgi:hypothetical protein
MLDQLSPTADLRRRQETMVNDVVVVEVVVDRS